MTSLTTDGNYTLPSLWNPTTAMHSALEWQTTRRTEVLEMFASNVYGHTPDGGGVVAVKVLSHKESALDGLATRTEFTVTLGGPLGTRDVSLLLYLPTDASSQKPVPAFLGLNFKGNHATTLEADVRVSTGENFGKGLEYDAEEAGEVPAKRGAEERRWPYRVALARGYAVATLHYEEIETDIPGAAAVGVRGLFDSESTLVERHDPEAWGAIGAWAWGLSRAFDVLASLDEIDSTSVMVIGHSRLGKTSLWAAAQDVRFAAAISNDSGCAGAALFRHKSGEDVAILARVRPHWFAPKFASYGEAESMLPIDQHQLLALVAPRPLHVASASLDIPADPHGEYLATLHATPVFNLFGFEGTLAAGVSPLGEDLSADLAFRSPIPSPGVRVGGQLSYHLREGGHDVLVEDWMHFLDFADHNLGSRASY